MSTSMPRISPTLSALSAYSQASAERAKGQLSRANSDSPTTTPLVERSFNVKRASSYRKPVPPFERPEAPTPSRGIRSTSVTEFPRMEEPSKWRVIFNLLKSFVLCRDEP